MFQIIELCDLCGDECRVSDLKPINHEESVCDECYKWHSEELLASIFSEIEIPDPVGYGEIEINPEDLETNKENNQ